MVSVCASLLNKKKITLHFKKSKSHAAVASSLLARSVGHSEAGVLICVLPAVGTAVHTNRHCTRPRELGRVGFPNPEEKRTGENKSAPSAAFLPSQPSPGACALLAEARGWRVCSVRLGRRRNSGPAPLRSSRCAGLCTVSLQRPLMRRARF